MSSEERQRIIESADALFGLRGYRQITMSDLAAHLGMSKKTIYLHFSSKEEIAAAVVDAYLARVAARLDEVNQEQNPMAKLRDSFMRVVSEVAKMSPIFLYDVQHLLPDVWQSIEDFRSTRIMAMMETGLTEAMSEGYARSVNPRVAAAIFLQCVQAVVQPSFIRKHQFAAQEVMSTLIDVFLRGIEA